MSSQSTIRASPSLSSVPPEILAKILEAAIEPIDLAPGTEQDPYDISDQYPDLISFCLVAKRWTHPAQVLLCRYIHLFETDRWLSNSTPRTHINKVVAISGSFDQNTDYLAVKQVLESCRGVEQLVLVGLPANILDCLAVPSLSSLKNLKLFNIDNSSHRTEGGGDAAGNRDPPPASYPWRLKGLEIESSSLTTTRVSAAFTRDIFSASANTLTHLSLDCDSPAQFRLAFPLVTPSLQFLSLLDLVDESCPPLLAGCTSLAKLVLRTYFPASVALIIPLLDNLDFAPLKVVDLDFRRGFGGPDADEDIVLWEEILKTLLERLKKGNFKVLVGKCHLRLREAAEPFRLLGLDLEYR